MVSWWRGAADDAGSPAQPGLAAHGRGVRTRSAYRRTILVALVAGVVSVAFLVAAVVLVDARADSALRAQARARVSETAALAGQLVAEQTLRFAELAQTHAQALGSLSGKPLGRLSSSQRVVVARELRATLTATPGLREASLLSPRGRLLFTTPPHPQALGVSFASRDWYQGVLLVRSPYLSRVFIAADGVKTVTVAALVFGARGGQVTGILTVGLEHQTQQLANSFARSQGIRLTVTDQSGSVVARSGLAPNAMLSLRGDPGVLAALRGRSSSSVRNGLVASYGPIPGTGWTVSASIPTSVAFQPANAQRAILILVAAVLGTLLAGFTGGLVLVLQRRARAEVAEAERFRTLNGQLERRVAQRTAQLTAANAELEAFTYTASHDLRAPLRTIAGYSGMLLEDYHGQLDEPGRRALERIGAGTKRMGTMIDELLQLARISRGELHREPVDLSAMATQVACELQAAQPGREVQWKITPGLTERADPELTRIVLENLLSNAWKFTSTHGHATIELGVLTRDGHREIFVRDNGVGFDMAHAGRLFQAFQRLHREEEFPGTGIGLVSVQRIVACHGGHISATSQAGHGATFTFTLHPDGTLNPGGR